jgi:hypothetical protein
MTISSTTRTAGPFTGNGVAYLFPFAFKVFAVGDLWVASALIATGVQTDLVLGTDYAVALNANQDSNPGGTVILTAGPLAVGYRLTVTSDLANLQPTEFLNQGGFYPEVLTASLDRATIQVQQLQDSVDLSLQFPITDPSTSNILPSAEVRAGMVLAFDVDGAPIAIAGIAGPAGPPGNGMFNLRGAWAAYTSYALGDLLTHGGASYTPTVAFTSGATFSATDLVLVASSVIVLVDGGTGLPATIAIVNGALVY